VRLADVRLLIVDDQVLVRTGLRTILHGVDDFEVVGEAGDGLEAVSQAAQLKPDVVLMDVRMPHLDGVEATARIRASEPAQRVILLTTFDLDEYVYAGLRAGASGFLLKDVPPADLLAAIRVVAAGDAVVAPRATRRLLDEFVQALPPAPDAGPAQDRPLARLNSLTAREREVLILVAGALSNAEIAERLALSEATVKTHVGRILTKLDLRDRVQAVVFAFETGLVRPSR
jgi:DNA-binding NarL/FixJ family response regulator